VYLSGLSGQLTAIHNLVDGRERSAAE